MSLKFVFAASSLFIVYLSLCAILVNHHSSGQLLPDLNLSLPTVNDNNTNFQSGITNNNTLNLFQPSENNITTNKQTDIVTESADSDLRVYANRQFGITLSYPKNWTASISNLGDYTQLVSLYSPLHNTTDVFPTRLTLSAIQFMDNISLAEYTNSTLTFLNQSQQFEIENSGEVTLGGYPAHRVTLSSTPINNSTLLYYTTQIWTTQGNKVFLITYDGEATKYNTHFPEVARMIQSLIFIE